MINSSTTVTVNDKVLNSDVFDRMLSYQQNEDAFSRWVVRPLMALTAIAVGATALFASVFFVVLAMALTPLLALSVWALKSKLKREFEQASKTDDSGEESKDVEFTHGQSHA